MTIHKVAVIGSGVMGSGIAAQIANAGVPVVLLDIKLPDKDLAAAAVERMLKTDPAPFMHPKNAKLIKTGNLEDNLNLLSECDWIVEVVLEDLKVKFETYQKIDRVRKKGSIVSSNTSTIPLKYLLKGQSEEFARDFLITHFFNPPRYMRLLELVTGNQTRADIISEITQFCDVRLGKGVVPCHDTPGFIANRLGVYWMQMGVNAAVEMAVPIEVADAVFGKPLGIPKTGIFGLIDLVGIDLMPKLAESLLMTLPPHDDYRRIYKDFGFVRGMISEGFTGRKGKGGFYRLDAQKKKYVLNLAGDEFTQDMYVPQSKVIDLPSLELGKQGLRAVLSAPDLGGQYAKAVLLPTLAYAASLVPEIADRIEDVDEAMRLGYNWKRGPFEMIDELGAAWVAEQLTAMGIAVPELIQKVGAASFYRIEGGKPQAFECLAGGADGNYHDIARAQGVLLLKDIKLNAKPVFKTASAAVWDIGDGVLCLEFTGKMNALDDQVFAAIEWVVGQAGPDRAYKALVIYNEGSVFSAGANLGLALFAANIAMWEQIEQLIAAGQKAYQALKFAPFPVVAAPSNLALGGGCEILLHADAVQAHAETYCGLVEVGVGFIPGWGGCKEMLLRYTELERQQNRKLTGGHKIWFSPDHSPMGPARKAFEVIGTAQVAKSADDAKSIGYLRAGDGVTMNRDRLLYDAKARALSLIDGYTPPVAHHDIKLAGPSGKMALDLAVEDLRLSGKATDYDVVVSGALACVLTGGDEGDWTNAMSEEDILKLEREEFIKLAKNPKTLARVEHMLNTGKPLRN